MKELTAPAVRRADTAFYLILTVICLLYVGLLFLLIGADVAYMVLGDDLPDRNPMLDALAKPEIRRSILLSLGSCTITAILSVWVAVPIGYLLTRVEFPGRRLVDAALYIPIVLPPLVVGLSLLILFQFPPFSTELAIPLGDGEVLRLSLARLVVYQVPAVILAQFTVSAAFAVRTMKVTFEQLNPRCEQVALTLGCTRSQAFWRVVVPQCGPGLITAFTLSWARALGEFGPILIFAGATRNKTEVLSTTVFLELSIGDLQAAVAVSLIMVIAAVVVLVIARLWGLREFYAEGRA